MDNKVFAVYMANSFLNGVEAFVILPSSLYYVTYLGYPKLFVGLLLAMVPVGCISSPIVGKLADKFVDGDTLLFATVIGHVIGNIIYSIPLSVYYPLFGRLVIGIASSSQGVCFGQTYKKSAPEDIPKQFLLLASMNGIGTCVGPLIGGLTQFRLSIFGWSLNPGNSTAVVMALVCLLVACSMVVCFCYETSARSEDKKESATEISLFSGVIEERGRQVQWSTLCCLIYLTCVILIMNACSGMCVQFLATKLFHLREMSVNMLFVNAVCFLISSYIIMYINATCYSDRAIYGLLIISQVISPLTLVIVSFLGDFLPFYGVLLLLPVVNMGMAAQVSSPFCRSLITKVVNPKDTSLYQSVFTSVLNVAYITSDVVVGMILDDAPFSFALLACIMIVLYFIGFAWYFKFSYKHLA